MILDIFLILVFTLIGLKDVHSVLDTEQFVCGLAAGAATMNLVRDYFKRRWI